MKTEKFTCFQDGNITYKGKTPSQYLIVRADGTTEVVNFGDEVQLENGDSIEVLEDWGND